MMIEPFTLEGEFVRLEPLRFDHLPALIEIGLEESLWKWTANEVTNEADLERYVRDALAMQAAGTALPFVTIEKSRGTIVGSTRFGNIDSTKRKAEIGWTWINPTWQRTRINTEAKLLMLTHAFETWKCIRVELKTDANNEKSRNAIARIGGVEEGTLRHHMITESGRFRDSVYFSIIDTEWEKVKQSLTAKLEAV
ncbi:MAG: GNAT family N-acetyltransferase [Blastocatellia bacterium]|nr:GNAT family N-acetyltransferase [Blastocatellia bacterium]